MKQWSERKKWRLSHSFRLEMPRIAYYVCHSMRSIKSNRGKPALIGLSITLATMAVVVISCTTTVDTNPVRFGGQQYAPPTAIRAIGGESSVIFVWKPSLDVDSSAFHGYYFSCLFTDTLGH